MQSACNGNRFVASPKPFRLTSSFNLLSKSDRWFGNVRNRTEYESVVFLRQQFLALPPPRDPTDEELLGDLFEIPKLTQEPAYLRRWLSYRWHDWPLGVIAARVAVLACVTLAILFQMRFLLWGTYRSYSTGHGEQQQITLADGTAIMLGGGTSLRVRLSSKERTVVLDSGEAMFEVRRDPNRPFVVLAATGSITALGTEFMVRRYSRHSNRVDVWVMEGTVEVAQTRDVVPGVSMPLMPGSWTSVRLNSGQEVVYDDQVRANPTRSSDVQATFRLNFLVYKQRPLGEVIEDVQRYTTRQIDIDPDVAALKYSGYVLPGKLDQWMRGLSEVFPELAVEDHGGTIRIRARLSRPVYGLRSVAR